MAEGNPLIVDRVPILILNSQLYHSCINIFHFECSVVALMFVIIVDEFNKPSCHLTIAEQIQAYLQIGSGL